jgi:hypothetical protein
MKQYDPSTLRHMHFCAARAAMTDADRVQHARRQMDRFDELPRVFRDAINEHGGSNPQIIQDLLAAKSERAQWAIWKKFVQKREARFRAAAEKYYGIPRDAERNLSLADLGL